MNAHVAGLVLAGGRSRRFGGRDKALIEIGGRSLAGHCLERLAVQANPVALNSNMAAGTFADLGVRVLHDRVPGHRGPLAGIHAGMTWAADLPDPPDRLATVAVDTPFFPPDLVARLRAALAGDRQAVAVAASAGRTHPTCALWPLTLAGPLRDFLETSADLSMRAFLDAHDVAIVEFPADDGAEPFFNINTPAEFEAAATRLARPA